MIPKPITKSGASLLPTSLVKDVPHASRGTSAAMVATLFYRTGDYLALTKPRVMSLVVFTAVVGLLVAPGHLDPFVGIGAILCIAAGAGAAGALNMWYDADVDALMSRTAARPIPRGRVAPRAPCTGELADPAVAVHRRDEQKEAHQNRELRQRGYGSGPIEAPKRAYQSDA